MKNYLTIDRVGISLGQNFGRWTVCNEDLILYKDRKHVELKCSCGNIGYVRADRLKKGLSLGCKHCQKMTNYPETRISSALHYNGLRKIFANKLYRISNLSRGNKKIDINITIEELFDILNSQDFKCALTGVSLHVLHMSPTKSNASIDRIDSSKGYFKNNIQWVLKDVNKMKNDFNQEYFINLCNLIAKTKCNNGNPDPSVSLKD